MSLSSDDTVEIPQLYSRYSTAIDTGDSAGFANCFVPDGVFDNGMALLEGSEAISKFAEQTYSAMPGMRHNATNIVLDAVDTVGMRGSTDDTDRATGSAFLIGYLVDDGYSVVATGRYADELVKTVDGWRFSKRVFKIDRESA